MESFACFRFPGDCRYTRIASETLDTSRSISSVFGAGNHGFIISPFEGAPVFIPAQTLTTHAVPVDAPYEERSFPVMTSPDPDYSNAFEKVHEAVSSGSFRKLVLSRRRVLSPGKPIDPLASFHMACREYPDMMVVLFSTPSTGTWLLSTPEILIESDGRNFHTVALAGTMKDDGTNPDWSGKNRDEQKVVCDYILDALKPFSDNFEVNGPYTVHAAKLLHLKTDIRFQAAANPGSLITSLHPTPAVCGMPADEAKSFLGSVEPHDRELFSGFCGPISINGGTSIYVSLRCMKIADDLLSATLFAGGGIMPGSDCASEFQETENKMQTIARCIVTR